MDFFRVCSAVKTNDKQTGVLFISLWKNHHYVSWESTPISKISHKIRNFGSSIGNHKEIVQINGNLHTNLDNIHKISIFENDFPIFRLFFKNGMNREFRIDENGIRDSFLLISYLFSGFHGFITNTSPFEIEISPYRVDFSILQQFPQYYGDISAIFSVQELVRSSLEFINRVINHLATSSNMLKKNLFSNRKWLHFMIRNIQDIAYAGEVDLSPITFDMWTKALEINGKVCNIESLKSEIFKNGLDDELISFVLPHLLEMYPPSSTYRDREIINLRLKQEYEVYKQQALNISEYQISNNHKISYFTIKQDINRTDRTNPIFVDFNKPGLQLLMRLLTAYATYNPEIGYIQGMNDLMVPIFFLFISFDDESMPICDVNEHEYMVFWCFHYFLSKLDHLSFLKAFLPQWKIISSEVLSLLQRAFPVVYLWAMSYDQSELVWLIGESIILFKRSFSSIWKIWIALITFPDPSISLVYFICSIFLLFFPKILCYDDYSTSTLTLKLPELFSSLHYYAIRNMMDYLYRNYPINKMIHDDSHNVEMPEFLKLNNSF